MRKKLPAVFVYLSVKNKKLNTYIIYWVYNIKYTYQITCTHVHAHVCIAVIYMYTKMCVYINIYKELAFYNANRRDEPFISHMLIKFSETSLGRLHVIIGLFWILSSVVNTYHFRVE